MSTESMQPKPPRIVAKVARPRSTPEAEVPGDDATDSSVAQSPVSPPAEPTTSYVVEDAQQTTALPEPVSEPTTVIPEPVPEPTVIAEPVAERTTIIAEPSAGEATAVLPQADLFRQADEERERARAERDARLQQAEAERQQRLTAQAERAKMLGTVAPEAEDDAVVETVIVRSTDKAMGSIGLLLLRLVTAAVVGIHGFNQLTTISATTDFISTLALPSWASPYANLIAWIFAIGGVVVAVLLIFGFLTRVAGFLVAVGAGLALAFIQWGRFKVLQGNGFLGERELLLAGSGALFLFVGAGGWALDAGFRRGRQERSHA